jgi:hypothetical protein
MWNLKIIFLSALTPFSEKQKLREKIDEKAKILAMRNGLHISFYSIIRSLPYRCSGWSDPDRTKVEQHIYFNINSRYIRAREERILCTYFHEYCHFLIMYSPPEIDFRQSGLYSEQYIPKDLKKIIEDFCDSFGIYIVFGSTGNADLDKFIKNFITITVQIIDREDWMKRIPESE